MGYSSQFFLHVLTENELDTLLHNGRNEFYKKNDLIIVEGDNSNNAYIIKSGKVKIFLSDEYGKEIVLAELKTGEYFGEMALIDKDERSASAIAMEYTEVTVISQKSFRECLQSNPEISERIMLGLVRRLREANKKISSLVFMDANSRVANMLLSLAEDQDGLLVIDNKPTHQHIANVVGTSREMITRILKNMADDGRIIVEGKQIILKSQSSYLRESWSINKG